MTTTWLDDKVAEGAGTPLAKANLAQKHAGCVMVDFGDGDPTSALDRTCDRCEGYFPDGLHVIGIPVFRTQEDRDEYSRVADTDVLAGMRLIAVQVVIGLCDTCWTITDREERAR